MLKDKLTMIIHTCDKFSDLWQANVSLLNKNWNDRSIKTLLVTDNETKRKFDNIEIICAGEGKELSERTKFAVDFIDTEYILISLDDYFLTKKIKTEEIIKIIEFMDNNEIDYVRFFNDPDSHKKVKNHKRLYHINLNRNYDVNLYPGIWKKEFLMSTIKEELNAWQYEVSLTKIAREYNAKCILSKRNEFPILDMVRKGKFLHKAKRYLNKNKIYEGNRQVIDWKTELLLLFRKFIKRHTSVKFVNFIKKKMIKKGYKFYSDI